MAQYVVDVRLDAIDLTEPSAWEPLGLTEDDFFGPWRDLRVQRPTPLMRIGAFLNQIGRIPAILYPSCAAHEQGQSGINVAVFRNAVVPPYWVNAYGLNGELRAAWPQ
jgi:hypothetical protein